MSHAESGPLASYNSLQDKHLAGYFSTSRMKRHLRKSGLVKKNGTIIDEKTYRINMAKKEHRKHVRDLLATAIVHKTLDIERVRQYEIRKRLDEAYKIELVRRVKTDEVEFKEGRNRRGDEDVLPLLSPRERTAHMNKKQHSKQRERPSTAPATLLDQDSAAEDGPLRPSEIYYDDDTQKIYYRVASSSSPAQMNGYLKDETEELGPSPYTQAYPSTYPAPAPPPSGTPRRSRTAGTPRRGIKLQRFHYLARTEPAVARRVQLQSMAEVTMKFLGPSLVLTNSMFPEDRLSEVMVLQQHCGGSTLCVFRELLPPNTIFTFISRRHRGAPFGLTFYIDGMQDIRLSSCCEYKHKPGKILGGRNGHFQFVAVEGAAPCYRCQVASAHKSSVKNQRKTSQGDDIGERSKTFLTEAGDEQNLDAEEEGQMFDVIITKINTPDGRDEDRENDGGEMVDSSTQTPRLDDDTKREEEVEVEVEVDENNTGAKRDNTDQDHNEGNKVAEGEEPGANEYDDEEFEESPEKDEGGESGAKEEDDKEYETKQEEEEYNEDFESDDEKEKEKERSDLETDKEVEKESDEESDKAPYNADKESDAGTDNESDKESNKGSDKDSDSRSDNDSDKEDSKSDKEGDMAESDKDDEEVEEIQDDTEEKDTTSGELGKQEEADEVEDEVEEAKEENADRPASAANSEGKQSKNVSFDDDVTVIVADQQEDKVDDSDQMEQDEGVLNDNEHGIENEAHDDEPKPVKNADDRVESPRLSDSSSDSSSSSSSSSSSGSNDSEDDVDRGRKSKKKKKEKKKTKSKPGQDPGSDPDLVSSGQLPEQALKAVGVTPGTKHEGSVQVLLEDKEDVEIAGVELTRDQFEEVARIIDSKEELGSVILRNTAADDSTIEMLAEPLKNSHDLKMLNLSVNRIGPAGSKHLATLIRENKSLRMLLLHGNPLTNEGVGMIVDGIVNTSNISLMNLDLGDCGLTEIGAGHIARLIEDNNTISILTISGNKFELEGWKAVSNALKHNTALETLSLDFNEIGDEEAVVIAEGLQECKNLRSIDLEGNKIGDEGARRLFQAVRANKSIIDLTLLPMNQIAKHIVDEVKEFLDLRTKGIEPEENDATEDNAEDPHGNEDSEEQPQENRDKMVSLIEPEETSEAEKDANVISSDIPAEGDGEGGQKGRGEMEELEVTEEGPPQSKTSVDDASEVEAFEGEEKGSEGGEHLEEQNTATPEQEGGNALDEEQSNEQSESVVPDTMSRHAEEGSSGEGPSTDSDASRQEKVVTTEDQENEEGERPVEPIQSEEPSESSVQGSSVKEPLEEIPPEEEPSDHGPSDDEPSKQEPPVHDEPLVEKKANQASSDARDFEGQDKSTEEES